MSRLYTIILFLGVTALCCHAQGQDFSVDLTDSFLRNLITDVYDAEQMAESGDSDGDDTEESMQQLIEDVTEQLQDIADRRMNLNALSVEELAEVPLLSEQQAEAILHYRALYGDLRTMAELNLITALDEPRRRLLRHLFTLAPAPRREPLRWSQEQLDSMQRVDGQAYYPQPASAPHSLSFTMGIPAYNRKGYVTPAQEGGYHGYNIMHTLRYRYRHRNVTAALTAAQDYGEPFFSGTNAKGYDFYTGFVRLKNQGFLEDLVLGHYQLSVGMGLIMNKRMRGTRTMLLTSAPDVRMTFGGHASRSASNYLQGAAATLRLPLNLHATLFASYNALDASIKNASDGTPASVTSVLTTGYHRTDTEISRRNTLRETVVGGAIAWRKAPYYLALSILNTHYDLPLRPTKTQYYRYFYPEGNDFFNASLAYSYTSSRLNISGEAAVSSAASGPAAHDVSTGALYDGGASGVSFATSNSLRWRLGEDVSLYALHRYLGNRFQSLHGKTMSVNSAVRNEHGIYLGTTVTPMAHLTLSAYTDFAYHPWTVYGIISPDASRSWEHQLQAEYSRTLNFADLNVQLRYRYKDNAITENPNIGTSAFVMPMADEILKGQHTVRLKARLKDKAWWTMAQIHYAHVRDNTKQKLSDGFLTALAGGVGRTFSVNASLSYFHTDDYSSRLYVQEPSLTYSTGTAMLYGHGLRSLLSAAYKASRNGDDARHPFPKSMSLAALVSLDHYFNRSAISSGMQMINGSNKCDVLIQALLVF